MPGPISRRTSEHTRRPLILTGFGVRLRIDHGALEVRNGFTHYPQKPEVRRFFPRHADLPSRIVILDGAGSVTFDVLAWLAEQDIPLVQLDYRGRVVAVIGTAGRSGGAPELVRAQVTAHSDPMRSREIATWLVREKLIAARIVIERHLPPSPARDKALDQHAADIERLRTPWTGELQALLGVEGRCAELYWRCWHGIELKWKGTGRRPIPDSWRIVGPRSSRATNLSNRAARHPVHAMLNYGYAVLESQIRIEVAKAGYDPTIGFLHKTIPERQALILDLMEPMRAKVDGWVLDFVQRETFSPADFTLGSDGTCWLHPGLAQQIVSAMPTLDARAQMIRGLSVRIGYVAASRRLHRAKPTHRLLNV